MWSVHLLGHMTSPKDTQSASNFRLSARFKGKEDRGRQALIKGSELSRLVQEINSLFKYCR